MEKGTEPPPFGILPSSFCILFRVAWGSHGGRMGVAWGGLAGFGRASVLASPNILGKCQKTALARALALPGLLSNFVTTNHRPRGQFTAENA